MFETFIATSVHGSDIYSTIIRAASATAAVGAGLICVREIVETESKEIKAAVDKRP